MDDSRFDDLTRALATGSDRRRFVRGLAAGLGGALSLAALRRGEAKPGGGGGTPQGRCPSGYTNCRGTCVDLTDNPNHCGACNLQCSPGKVCVNGACACPPEAPNVCPDTGGCLAACPVGRVFDPATCTCACVEQTCCACQTGSGVGGFCSAAFATQQECFGACAEAAAGSGHSARFGGEPGTTWVCDATGTGCVKTCDETP